MFGYARGLHAASTAWGSGTLLYATELVHNDGPWRHPDDLQKLNTVLRYSEGSSLDGFSLTAMAYGGRWMATNQIAKPAVISGAAGRLVFLGPRDGGDPPRHKLSGG